jgi:hypothetical protein
MSEEWRRHRIYERLSEGENMSTPAQHARDQEAYEQWFGDKPVEDFLEFWNPIGQSLGDYCEDALRNAYDSISRELEAPIPEDDLREMIEGITAYVKHELEGEHA